MDDFFLYSRTYSSQEFYIFADGKNREDMPTNKNALERYFIIDELLSDRYHYYSVEDIKEECEKRLRDKYRGYGISIRQIQKDLKFLSDEGPFCAEIEEHYYDSEYKTKDGRAIQKRGLRYKKPSFSIFKKELSDNQKRLLSEVFTVMGRFDGIPGLDALNDLKGELKINDSKRIVEFSRNPIEDTTHFAKLFMAISNKQVVKLHYHVFPHPEIKKEVLVHPYLLKEYNSRWYLICGADDTGNVLNFVVDERLEDIEPRPELPYKECKEDLADRFDEIVGVTYKRENECKDILFWVSNASYKYVENRPIHISQVLYKGKKAEELHEKYLEFEGGTFFKITCRENEELYKEFLSYGKELVVLEPHIRKIIQDRIKEMYKMYGISEH